MGTARAQLDDVRDITEQEYQLFRDFIYQQCGINLGEQKKQLVRSRLGKRVREGGFSSYREYYEFVKNDTSGDEITRLIDAVSTNTTHLFRESKHFDFLVATLKRWTTEAPRKNVIRIWSAGCSSGEEPYTIAITVDDALGGRKDVQVKILATDISTRVLACAEQGRFDEQRMAEVPAEFRKRYFTKDRRDGSGTYVVDPKLRQLIRFARFNLMSETFSFKNPFDVIFCRNVMIYFDKPTQEKLVNKYAKHLSPGGYLLIGHSESLNSINHPLTYVKPTIYQKKSS